MLDDSVRLAIKKHIEKILERVLKESGSESQCFDKQLKALYYMEVLMENFGLGLETIEIYLPLGQFKQTQCCLTVINFNFFSTELHCVNDGVLQRLSARQKVGFDML